MAKQAREPKRRSREVENQTQEGDGHQLSLLFEVTAPVSVPVPVAKGSIEQVTPIDPVEGLDRMIKTAELVRLLRRHRTTIFRWIKRGLFPPRHKSGDWRRSDIENWIKDQNGSSTYMGP